ncbi:MAG: hypothetical protein WB462_09615 [Solirubrobacterales bacterium]
MPDYENLRVEATEFLDAGENVVVIGRGAALHGMRLPAKPVSLAGAQPEPGSVGRDTGL